MSRRHNRRQHRKPGPAIGAGEPPAAIDKCLSLGPDGYVCVAIRGHAGHCVALGAHGEALSTWRVNQAGIRIQGSEGPAQEYE